MKSIIQKNKECYVCKTTINLHKHHIFEGTANRKKSEQYGCWCYLCAYHHNMSNEGVHFDKRLELRLKRIAQREFENMYDRETFMDTFHRNYLGEEW